MKIAVVGATGNIGAGLSRVLLQAGQQVRALSRGGPKLRELVQLGAEPFAGSFDDDTPNVGTFFQGADAAFTMVRSDWSNLDHYQTVAERLARALDNSSVKLVVNLSSFGADLKEHGGHSTHFYQLESELNRLSGIRIVHLRCGWFMENFMGQIETIARYDVMASMLRDDLKLPLVATRDISAVAAREFLNPATEHRVVREVQGSEDRTMPEAAAVISKELGRPIGAISVAMDRPDVRQAFVSRFGTVEQWDHRVETYTAFNEGRVRFHEPRSAANSQPTRFADFLRDAWRPAYDMALKNMTATPSPTFQNWLASISS